MKQIVICTTLIIGWILAACQPVTLAPMPALSMPVRVVLTPGNSYFAPLVERCTGELTGLTATVQILPVEDARKSIYDLAITSGEGLTDFTYQLGTDTLAIIVHPSNSISNLTDTQFSGIYGGYYPTWQSVAPEVSGVDATQAIQVFGYASNDDLGKRFTERWMKEGVLSLRASIAPGPEEMIEAISANSTAIGYIPGRWLTSTVKKISVGEDEVFPTTMSTMKEPEESLRDLMGCLQRIVEGN
jgi:hypothetical protein